MKLHIPFSLAFLCSFLFSVSLIAQDLATPLSEVPTTKITFDETEYDFGTVVTGEQVSQIYTFKNTGDEPLILTNAKGSCGCTVPRWPREPIAPGETASIEVSFNSENKRGKRNQKVTITSNTNPAQTFLYLKGTVVVEEATLKVEVSENLSELEQEAIDIQKQDCVAVYPNPTADILKLELAESIGKSATVRIFSDRGQLMAEKVILSIDGLIEFEVQHYPVGTYIANVQVGEQKPMAHCFVVSGK